jgi:O-antigen biosynthesis protein
MTKNLPDNHTRAEEGTRVHRVRAQGKHFEVDGETWFLKGVTYGTFRPDENGDEYPAPEIVREDFAAMAAIGCNAVRLYTVPPRWLLDLAWEHGLHVMPNLAIERTIGYLNDRRGLRRLERGVRDGVRSCASHPAILCWSLGNEIPAQTVRWLGRKKVERALKRLAEAVRSVDPAALVTFVNYPTAEYLELPFLDVVSFNVYLEDEPSLVSYLARLQSLAGARPLVMTELGLDSCRNGQDAQADVLSWQLRVAYESGCAGSFVYAWTDEWHRGGEDVHDWDFGLTGRNREPKPALAAVRRAYANVPFAERVWPSMSIVICAYNAAGTIEECLERATKLDYPDYEILIVDDGSTDATAALASGYPCRVVSTENRGLSAARNLGLELVQGEILVYLDSDAWPDRNWLKYLAHEFVTSDAVGVGGPNLPPPDDNLMAHCVANSPGGPCEVLIDDKTAEHIPGCNMAFRRDALIAIGGFDERFRSAGDDVDLCWRLQDAGGTIRFSPSAVVWHHRRGELARYWKQQRGYGHAEALLEQKWPSRYNVAGHVSWRGVIYGHGAPRVQRSPRVYQGTWGLAPFQRLYHRPSGSLVDLLSAPEWLFVPLVAALVGSAGLFWPTLLYGWLVFAVALAPLGVFAVQGSRRARPPAGLSLMQRWRFRICVGVLHVIQPLARLSGRLANGLTPWRLRGSSRLGLPIRRSQWLWSTTWRDPAERLRQIEERPRALGGVVRRNGAFERWDLEVRCAPAGRARLLASVEEHGGGAQLVRWRTWPVPARWVILLAGAFAAAGVVLGAAGRPLDAVAPMAVAGTLFAASMASCSLALGLLRGA